MNVSLEMMQFIGACLVLDDRKRPDVWQVGGLQWIRKVSEWIEGRKSLCKDASMVSTQ